MHCICRNPKCRYEWNSRSREKPKSCPSCKRYNWSLPPAYSTKEAAYSAAESLERTLDHEEFSDTPWDTSKAGGIPKQVSDSKHQKAIGDLARITERKGK